MASCAFKANDSVCRSTRRCCRVHGNGLGRSAYACVPHATVLSGCYSQRRHALGALTECLYRHIAGSLGRPPRLRVIVLSLLCSQRTSRRAIARKAHRRDGSVASRSAPVMLPARLFAGARRPINNPGRRTNQELFFGKSEGIALRKPVRCFLSFRARASRAPE